MIFIRNLLRNRARSFMTLMGAALGISVFVSIHAITDNILRETREVIAGYDTDIMVQSKSSSTPFASRISQEEFRDLHAMFGEDVTPLVVATLREKWNPYALIIGVPHSFASRFGLVEGRVAAADEREIMAGNLIAQRLGLKAGGTLSLGNADYRVSGIYNMGNNVIDGALMVNMTVAQKLIGAEKQVNLAMLRVRNKGETQRVLDEIDAKFPRLTALSSYDFISGIRLFKVVETFARAVALISFAGSCLVVTNTFLMAVAERTQEIGILMAIGWSPLHVLRLLLAESLTLCLGGAVAGNVMALLLLRALNQSSAVGFGWIPVGLSSLNIFYSIVIAIVLACVALIWPVIIVHRMSPVTALRHD